MKKLQIAVLALMLVAVFAAPARALAAPLGGPSFEDVVIFGDDYTVANGQTVNGSLVIFGGSATVENAGTVTGEVIIFGGSATLYGKVNGSTVVFGGDVSQNPGALNNAEVVIFGGGADLAGHVSGDVVVFGGDVDLASTAVVDGDLSTPGGEVARAAGAVVNGNLVDNFQFNFPRNMATPEAPVAPVAPVGPFRGGWGGDFFDRGHSVIWLLFRSFAMSTVALLVVLFAPNQLRRVADAVLAEPVSSAGYGILGFVVAVIATIGLSITLILIPVAILIPFVVVCAVAFGWIALGMEVGRRMADAFHANWSPVLEAMLGTFALTFVAGIVGWVPCIGFLASKVVTVAGFGAVILSRFGSQAVTPRVVAQPAPANALPAPRKKSTRKSSK
jgi:hypothetical protein